MAGVKFLVVNAQTGTPIPWAYCWDLIGGYFQGKYTDSQGYTEFFWREDGIDTYWTIEKAGYTTISNYWVRPATYNITVSVHMTPVAPTELSVDFRVDKATGTAPLPVNLTVDIVSGVAPFTFNLDYGDGSPPYVGWVNEPMKFVFPHTYQTMGTYKAVLTVADAYDTLVTDLKIGVGLTGVPALVPLAAALVAGLVLAVVAAKV